MHTISPLYFQLSSTEFGFSTSVFIHLLVKFDSLHPLSEPFLLLISVNKICSVPPVCHLASLPTEVKILRISLIFFCVYLVVQSSFFPLLGILSSAYEDSMKHISITLSLVYWYKGCTISAVLIVNQAASSGFIRILLWNMKWNYRDIFRVHHLP